MAVYQDSIETVSYNSTVNITVSAASLGTLFGPTLPYVLTVGIFSVLLVGCGAVLYRFGRKTSAGSVMVKMKTGSSGKANGHLTQHKTQKRKEFRKSITVYDKLPKHLKNVKMGQNRSFVGNRAESRDIKVQLAQTQIPGDTLKTMMKAKEAEKLENMVREKLNRDRARQSKMVTVSRTREPSKVPMYGYDSVKTAERVAQIKRLLNNQ